MRGLPGTSCRRRIYLMRHAEVSYFDADGRPLDPRHVSLTAAGRRQAEAAAALLAGVPLDLAVCSGLPRTEQTARIVLGNRDLSPCREPRFKEVRGGRLADVPAAERDHVIGRAYDRAGESQASFIGGEAWRDVEARVLAGWHELFADDTWLTLLVVAHDAVNRVLLAHVCGAGLAGLKAFEQDYGCVNIIEADVDAGCVQRAYLRAVNIAPYDPVRDGSHLTVMERVYRLYRPA